MSLLGYFAVWPCGEFPGKSSSGKIGRCLCVIFVNNLVNSCLSLLTLWWTGDLSRVYPASCAGIASSTPCPMTLNWISGRRWINNLCLTWISRVCFSFFFWIIEKRESAPMPTINQPDFLMLHWHFLDTRNNCSDFVTLSSLKRKVPSMELNHSP